jgi:SPP1 gp7 family putative phage head morphogenesis protein
VARPRSAPSDLSALLSTSSAEYSRLIAEIGERLFDRRPIDGPLLDLADLIQASGAIADLLGRRRLLLQADAGGEPARYFSARVLETPPGILPRVVFREALRALLESEPRLEGAYGDIERVHTEARAAEKAREAAGTVARRVQSALVDFVRRGARPTDKAEEIARIGDWGRAYAHTVFANNVSSAYTAGILRQASDPETQVLTRALRYSAVMDVDTRPNHRALDGLIAAPDDPIWRVAAPPAGHNCRCSLDLMTTSELQRAGLLLPNGRVRPASLPNGAYRDPGFLGNANPLSIYGAA